MTDPICPSPTSHRSLLALLLAPLCIPAFVPPSAAASLSVDESSAVGIRAAFAPDADAIEFGVGLDWVDGVLTGVSAAGRARFLPGHVEVTPVLGAGAPQSLPLSIAFREARLGATRLADAAQGAEAEEVAFEASVESESRRVRYRHASGFEERWDATRAGFEFSFLLSQLPAERAGDLVIATQLDTELEVRWCNGELCLTDERGRGLRIGGVLAIDGDGRRQVGELRFAPGRLDLVVPESFVRTASLPLLVDPLIGPASTEQWGVIGERLPVAYMPGLDRYLVVYQRIYSASDQDILGRLFTGLGTATGNILTIEGSPSVLSREPDVVTMAPSERFLVAWEAGTAPTTYCMVRSVNVFGVLLSQPVLISAGGTTRPRLGGESMSGTFALAVVRQPNSTLRAQAVHVPASGDPLLGDTLDTLVVDEYANNHTVTAHRGRGPYVKASEARYWLVGWDRFWEPGGLTPPPGDHDVLWRLVFVDDAGQPKLGDWGIVSTLLEDERELAVDTNGRDYLLAYRYQPSLLGATGPGRIRVKLLRREGTSLTAGWLAPEIELAVAGNRPAVAALDGEQFFVAWGEDTIFAQVDSLGVFGRVVDVRGLYPCEPIQSLGGNAPYLRRPQLASRYSAGGPLVGSGANEAMAVYHANSSKANFAVRRRVGSLEGLNSNLGGGCQGGGLLQNACPATRGLSTYFDLSGAQPWTSGLFVLSMESLPFLSPSCGTCMLIADPFLGLYFGISTDASGRMSFPIQVPTSALVGTKLIGQVILLTAPVCASGLPALSNAVQIEVH